MLDEVYGEVNKFKKACNAKQPEELLLVSVSFCCIVNLNQGRIYGRGLGPPPPPLILDKKKKKKKKESEKEEKPAEQVIKYCPHPLSSRSGSATVNRPV